MWHAHPGYSGTKIGMEAGYSETHESPAAMQAQSSQVNLNYLGTFNHDPHVVGEDMVAR